MTVAAWCLAVRRARLAWSPLPCSRCGRPTDTTALAQVYRAGPRLWGGELVCPACLTPDETQKLRADGAP